MTTWLRKDKNFKFRNYVIDRYFFNLKNSDFKNLESSIQIKNVEEQILANIEKEDIELIDIDKNMLLIVLSNSVFLLMFISDKEAELTYNSITI